MNDNSIREAEDARLHTLRAELIEADRAQAAIEATRVMLLAEAGEIAQARMARSTSGNSRGAEMELRSIALELAVPLRVSDRVIQRRIGDADQLTRLFPATVVALADGRISRAHASALLDFGCVIADADARTQYEQEVLAHAETTTAARTRAYAERQAELRNPRPIDERAALARQTRGVWVTDLGDGIAELRARIEATLAHGITDRLTRQAKAIEKADAADRREDAEAIRGAAAAGPASEDAAAEGAADEVTADVERRFDERSRDQKRADIFTDLLLTGTPCLDTTLDRSPGGLGAIHAQVQLTVPLSTLTGVTTGGAELDGRCVIDDTTARRLAGNAPLWDRVFTDPLKGTVVAVDAYPATAAQRRFLSARDVHCRMPGCRRPVREAQFDHNHEWQHGGATDLRNLAGLCVRHHTLKTESQWTVRQLGGGTLEWTSPLGYQYEDRPPTRVVFVPDGGDAPF